MNKLWFARALAAGVALCALAAGVGPWLSAQSGAAPSRPWNCWVTAGRAAGVFANAVVSPPCLAYPAQAAPIHIGLSSRAVIPSPIVSPAAPTALVASVVDRTAALRWAPPAGAAPVTYVLEAGSSSGQTDLALTDTGSATPALVATAMPPGRYYVRLRARTANGVSAASNEVIVTVGGAIGCAVAPGAPTGLTFSVSGTSVTLSWQAPGGTCEASSYILEAGSATGLTNLATVPTGSPSTTFSASGVAPGTYFVRVRAANGAGTSSTTSNEVSLTIGSAGCTSAPTAPTLLASVVTGSTVTLSWVAPATGCTPTAYFLEAGSAAGLTDLAATSTGSSAPSYTATAVPDRTYFVRVRSINAIGQSGVSNEVQLTVGGTASTSWVAEGVRLTNATSGFSGVIADTSTIRLTDGRYRMYLVTGGVYRSAISADGLSFAMESGTRLQEGFGHARALRLADGRIRIFHISAGGISSSVSSDDGVTFTADAGERISARAVGASALSGCSIVRTTGGTWRMYFSDLPVPGAGVVPVKIYSAVSSDLLTWTADAGVRIGPTATLTGNGEHPGAFANSDGTVTLFYFRNSTLTFLKATSADGLTFATESSVGLSLANDPDVVQLPDLSFRMYYNWGDDVGGAIYSASHAAGSLKD